MKNLLIKTLSLGFLSILLFVGCEDNQDEIDAIEARIDQIIAQDVQSQIATLENKINSLPTSGDVTKLQGEIDNLKQQIGSSQEELDEANTIIEDLRKQIAELEKKAIISKKIEDLFAPAAAVTNQQGPPPPPSGKFVKFSFATGETTTSDTQWDIAFRTTTILVNGGSKTGSNDEPERTGQGGAYIVDGLFNEVNIVDESIFKQDTKEGPAIPTGSGNGWYNYQPPPTNLINPIPGKVLVFKTHDEKYAKVEILSFYKGAPNQPNAITDEARYYTFNYVYQPNKGEASFE
ncbi:MAG: DUF2730 family protein [Flavobacteriaceae bacterium]|nr:DUF2730 family protein [Flavobacteriaceae bacterium]